VGSRALQVCELIIGREIPSRRFDPAAAYWKGQGIRPKVAAALSRAGIASAEDLRKFTREELLAVRGVAEITLAQLETLLGRQIPSRTDYWLSRGLVLPIANALAREGIHTLDELAQLSSEQFLSFRGLGYYALGQCEKLLGHKLPSRPRGTHET
jgi:DNA-directed RNA polymerase alpha subunit